MGKTLVTGGLGFIGYHLVERLLSEGEEVVIIDKMNDVNKEIQEEKWMRIGRNDLVTLIDGELKDLDLSKEFKDVDVIYHLAAATTSDSKWPKLAKVIQNNVSVTKEIVKAMPKKARLIYASTVEVYGERPGEITERTPTNPTSAYGITKLASERLIEKECAEKATAFQIVRLPTIYGPWQRDDMTYQQLIVGNTNPDMDRSTLDVLYVNDCIEAFRLAATCKCTNETFHLSSGQEGAWYEGLKLLGYEGKIKPNGFKTTLSSSKSFDKLGFTPKTSLQEGLAKQLEHVKQWQKQQRLS
ncbi:UDP-glucose 4-epimerase [Halalkalibacter wakoensis JCM 9140]|uniref:UDP-glucose 4-epimerase n=1 Tax=Halalkalibacter wakoensis JCM 9140 TaxID=1236970 RepID=W4PZJ1_9BACI|nr:NAD(P)-dependent oxidoreductase [Halalkalibacter wakoensis]GAE25261.1 UDP-glucose 4-epimerase [Halalkalibacter wakoensis JCM 9140]